MNGEVEHKYSNIMIIRLYHGENMEFLKKIWAEMRKKKVPLFICLVIVLSSLYLLADQSINKRKSGFVFTLENILLDQRFKLRGPVKSKTKIGILAVDDKSLKAFGRWPFSRKYYARVFDNLKKLGVTWVGMDSIFSEPERPSLSDASYLLKEIQKTNSSQLHTKIRKVMTELDEMRALSLADRSFVETIQKFENVVMGYFYFEEKYELELAGIADNPFKGLDDMLDSELAVFLPEDKELSDYPKALKIEGLVPNIPQLSTAVPYHGFFSNKPDPDAIVRWVTLVKIARDHLMPSLSLKLAAEALERDIVVFFKDTGVESISLVDREDDSDSLDIPIDPGGVGRILLNHRGGRDYAFPHISIKDVYDDNFTDKEREELKGMILLFGATAIGISDQRANPFDSVLDGVENHAAVVDNIMSRDFMHRPADIDSTELSILLVIGLLFSIIMIWSSAAHSALFAILFFVGYYYFDKYFWFSKGTWAYMGMPFLEIGSLFITVTLYKYIVEEKEKRKVKGAFAHYLSPDVISEVLESDSLNLGGVRKKCTVFFSDVRGFTTISESLSPEQLSQFMNEYFTPMTSIILETKGCLDKYIGDAIMAFWGAPIEIEDQADVACHSAIRMLFALDIVKEEFKKKNFPDIEVGIGLNTGAMSVGNMGSAERLAYTVMGDQVNLGARLEGLTKEYGIKIMVSEFTIAELKKPEDFFFRDLDDIRVKGKNEPTRVYELMRPDYLSSKDDILKLISEFNMGRECYRNQEWEEAETHFKNCLKLRDEDGPSIVFLRRIEPLKNTPKLKDWQGVHTFTHK